MQLIEELGMDEVSVDTFRRIAGIPKPPPKPEAKEAESVAN